MITINEVERKVRDLEMIGQVIIDQNFTGRDIGRTEEEMMKTQLSCQYYNLMNIFTEFNRTLIGSSEQWGKDELFLLKSGTFRHKNNASLKERTSFSLIFRIAQAIRSIEWIANRFHYRLSY
tara:strand:+ start:937 stop:1302 length:366 start_codon:yes stop_codon:yes gene_type:complete